MQKTSLPPGQLAAIQEVMTLPEEATIWVTENFSVWEGFKTKAVFQGNTETVQVSVAVGGPPVGTFTVGKDAFYDELSATQAARFQLMQYLAPLIAQGEYLADRERELTKGEQNE